MAWSWSHTNEGVANVQTNVERLDKETLEVIYAEWKAGEKGHFHPRSYKAGDDLDFQRYDRALGKAKLMTREALVESVWPLVERLATCTNGGWEAWCCPYGCPVHMVSFDAPEEEEEEDDAAE